MITLLYCLFSSIKYIFLIKSITINHNSTTTQSLYKNIFLIFFFILCTCYLRIIGDRTMLEFTINCWALHSFFILDIRKISAIIYMIHLLIYQQEIFYHLSTNRKVYGRFFRLLLFPEAWRKYSIRFCIILNIPTEDGSNLHFPQL